jgi:1,4-alpha-glucan branching enzyme
LRGVPNRAALGRFVARLASVYKEQPALWRDDASWGGFSWIDVADKENSVIAYVRRDAESHVVVVLNLTPVPRRRYRVGVPENARYTRVLSSDDEDWGGSGYAALDALETDTSPFHGQAQSIEITLPPLAAVVLAPARQ